MNAFERVSAFLSHKEADRVPVYPILCGINRKLVVRPIPSGPPTRKPAPTVF